MEACVTSIDGQKHVKQRLTGKREESAALGERMAQKLIKSGAQAILEAASRARG